MSETLRNQYEAYPYPARNPADETSRLITGSPSHLAEVTHYVFGGRLDFGRPLRVLIAGGGTGDAAIMLAQQLSDAGVPAELVYIDLSNTARGIAEHRARMRGLTNLHCYRGSFLELPAMATQTQRFAQPFDYIDCCGVLHHLPDPEAGVRALLAALAPGGGLGLMVYAPYGRTGVYPLQAALRLVAQGLPDAERVRLARRLLANLPETNWFRHNHFLSDHQDSDAGLYDLLLHSRDQPFTIEALHRLLDRCGLAITGLIEPARYQPETYVSDPKILAQLRPLPWIARAAWSEQVSGAMTKHIVYAVRKEDASGAVASAASTQAIPVPRDLDAAALAGRLGTGNRLQAELYGQSVELTLPRLAAPILAAIDGQRSIAEIHRALSEEIGWAAFKDQFDQLFATLNGLNKLFLRLPARQSP